jgi:hypothetical protein
MSTERSEVIARRYRGEIDKLGSSAAGDSNGGIAGPRLFDRIVT